MPRGKAGMSTHKAVLAKQFQTLFLSL